MIKKLEVPVIDLVINIYYGKNGFKEFQNKVRKTHPDWNFNDQMLGYCFENNIWLFNTKDTNTIFHELQHLYDWLFNHYNIEEETEFKAYLSSYINCEILKIKFKGK